MSAPAQGCRNQDNGGRRPQCFSGREVLEGSLSPSPLSPVRRSAKGAEHEEVPAKAKRQDGNQTKEG